MICIKYRGQALIVLTVLLPLLVIQKLHGSLDEHDYGFFITTSDFSSGAKEEALRTGGGKPIVLVNGRHVVNLLMEHGIGVTRSALDVYELDEESLQVNHGVSAFPMRIAPDGIPGK